MAMMAPSTMMRSGLGGGDRGPQAGAASAEDQDVGIKMVHRGPLRSEKQDRHADQQENQKIVATEDRAQTPIVRAQ
jgi:hypothetical protein